MEELSVQVNSQITQIATLGVLKCYAKFLKKSDPNANPEQIYAKLGPIMSAMLDRGELTQAAIDEFTTGMQKSGLFLKTVEDQKHREKFLTKALMTAVQTIDSSALGGDDAALLQEAKETFNHMVEIRNQVVAKYGDLLLGAASTVFHNYQQMFDPGFAAFIEPVVG